MMSREASSAQWASSTITTAGRWEKPRARGRPPGGELLQQPGLADARLAGDQDGGPAPPAGAHEGGQQLAELGVPFQQPHPKMVAPPANLSRFRRPATADAGSPAWSVCLRSAGPNRAP